VAFVAEWGSGTEADLPGAARLTRDRTVQGVCEGAPKRDLADLNINHNTSPVRGSAQRASLPTSVPEHRSCDDSLAFSVVCRSGLQFQVRTPSP
jgi:hypothetical protein